MYTYIHKHIVCLDLGIDVYLYRSSTMAGSSWREGTCGNFGHPAVPAVNAADVGAQRGIIKRACGAAWLCRSAAG